MEIKELKPTDKEYPIFMCLVDKPEQYTLFNIDGLTVVPLHQVINALLPSDQQDSKTGKWIKKIVRGNEELYCSNCGDGIDVIYEYNFCPNCGARMSESEGK